jgi:hypothetical protein
MSNQEIAEAEARLAALRAEHGEDKAVNPLFDSLGSLLHGLVNLAPWRQESDKQAAHAAVEEHAAEPVGRNSVAAGVVEQNTTEANSNKGDVNSFPGSNPQE